MDAPSQDQISAYGNYLKSQGVSEAQVTGYTNYLKSQYSGSAATDGSAPPQVASNNPQANIDNSHIQDFVNKNVSTLSDNQSVRPADGFWDAFVHVGLATSSSADFYHILKNEIQRPDAALAPNASKASQYGAMVGGMIGDLPANLIGYALGGSVGSAMGGLAGSIAGPGGAAIGALAEGNTMGMAGAFALPAAIRKLYTDDIEKGNPTTPMDFVRRLLSTTYAAIKGGSVGAIVPEGGAVAEEGGAAITKGVVNDFTRPIVANTTRLAGEAATMATASALIEKKLPHPEDFENAALSLLALHAGVAGLGLAVDPEARASVATKLRNIYANTGDMPADVAEKAQSDAALRGDIISKSENLPPQAQPTELNYNEGEEKSETSPGTPPAWELTPKETPKSTDTTPQISPEDPRFSDAEKTIMSHIQDKEVGTGPTMKEKFSSWYQNNLDAYAPLKDAEYLTAEKIGKTVSMDKSSYVAARLLSGWNDKMNVIWEHGFPDFMGKFNGDSFDKVFTDLGSDPVDRLKLQNLMVALRTKEKTEQGFYTGLPVDAAEKTISELSPKYLPFAKRVVALRNEALHYGVDKGLLDQKMVNASIKQNEYYINFSRVMPDENEPTSSGPGGFIHRFKGETDLDLESPLTNTLLGFAAIIKRADINEVRQLALKNLTYTDSETGKETSDFLKEVNPQVRVLEASKEEIRKLDLAEYTKMLRNKNPELSRAAIEKSYDKNVNGPKFDKTFFRHEVPVIGENQIPVYRNGKMTVLEGDPMVIAALRRLEGDRTSMNLATKIASKFTQATVAGYVKNPTFQFNHAFRSLISQGIFSKTGQVPFLHALLNIPEFIAGKSDDVKGWIYNGGSVGVIESLEKKWIDTRFDEFDKKENVTGKVWNAVRTASQKMDAGAYMADNLGRFTEYKRAIDQGQSPTGAAFMSREVSPDYGKATLTRSAYRSIVAFQHAMFESTNRMAQEMKNNPKGMAINIAAYLVAPSVLAWAANHNEKWYKDSPNWLKDTNWQLQIPGTNYIMRLKKPWSMGVMFASGTENMLSEIFDKDHHAFDGFLNDLESSLLPSIVPDFVKPELEQFMNKSFFKGTPLVSYKEERVLPELQYKPYTSPTMKGLGKLVGYVPFIGNAGPLSDQVSSPEVMQNYVRDWTGTLGSYAEQLSDAAVRESTGEKAQLPTDLSHVPIISGLISRYPSMNTQPIEDVYANYERISQIANSIREYSKMGDSVNAMRLMREHPEWESGSALSAATKAFSRQRKVIQNILNDPTSSPTEKRQLVDSIYYQMNGIAQQANSIVDRYKRGQ